MRRMHAVIKKFGVIESLELQNECGRMSISTYNKLKRAFLKTYADKLGFEKQADNHLFYDRKPTDKEKFKLISQVIQTEKVEYCGDVEPIISEVNNPQESLN